jgi:hypothetical protein
MFDFPSGPSIGQKYPASPVAGQPTYTWDGVKWKTSTVPIAGKLPVYTDGSAAMVAALTLSGNPVNATDAADKSYVDSNVGGGVPSGTVMVFYQAAAPTGWTQVSTHNDKALRVVSSAGGGSGGVNGFSTVMAQATVGGHTLSTGEVPPGIGSSGSNPISVAPAGDPTWNVPLTKGGWSGGVPQNFGGTDYFAFTSGTANPVTYTGSFSASNNIAVYSGGGGGSHNHPITMSMLYCDVILASKN